MRKELKSQQGFTLLETLIAMVILGISISILVEGFLIVTDTIEYQRNYNYLINWSESKINEIAGGRELARHGGFEYSERLFQWSVEESFQYSEGLTGLRKINLTIEWQGSNSKNTYIISRLIL